MDATYRPITDADVSLAVEMMADFYAIDGYPIEKKVSREMMIEFIKNENQGKGWLISADGKIAGYIILTFLLSFEFGGQIAFLDELYIVDEMRGKGLGNKAVQFIKEEAAKLKLKLLFLEVETHHAKAQKMYLAAGFKMHGRQLMQYKIEN